MKSAPQAAVIMGSKSDWDTMMHAVVVLEKFGIPHEARVVSAHRTPDLMPGAILGVMGSGQPDRMFAIAARRMGYPMHTFSPEYDPPTGQVVDHEVTASYVDEAADLIRTARLALVRQIPAPGSFAIP